MGKKTKKTRWRALPIEVGASSNGHDKNHNHYHHQRDETSKLSPSPINTETKIYFNEDEYTKITTPRQDVLFKKGYFARRRYQLATANTISDPSSGYDVPSGEYLEGDYINEDYDAQGYYSAPQNYVDPSVGMYYNYGSNSYEVYDPYTGNMTVLVGPTGPQYPPGSGSQQLMAPMSCPPIPVDWYNPASIPPQQTPYYPNSKHFPGDSSQAYTSAESMCPPTSPQDLCDDPTLYPHSFIYPGYMLSNTSAYHTNGGGGVPVLTSLPQTSPCDSSSFKKRKRRKKRKREGVTEEEYESSSEDQCSQSGASEQLDSKTTSDSGVHTHNSGESTPVTPPLSISFHPHVPCHPILPFTSTDEDSTPDMTASSIPCFTSSQVPVNYTPYHHINYNYNSDRLTNSTSSVIDQQYVMHNKSKKLKTKRPKADLNKFFPSPSLSSNPCSYHSRDLSVPNHQPAPKQLTILKPDTPRKFPMTQITILKPNTSISSQIENSIKTQKDSISLPTSNVIESVSKESTSTMNFSSTENVTNTNCSTQNTQKYCLLEGDEGKVKDDSDSAQIKKDTPTLSLSTSEELNKSSKTESECIDSILSDTLNKQIEVNNADKKTADQDDLEPNNENWEGKNINKGSNATPKKSSKEESPNPKQPQLNEDINDKTSKTKDSVQLLTNGYLPKSQDKCLKRSPSPQKKNIINGFHKPEYSKPIENGFDKVKQKQKTKKTKTNQIINNSSHINGYVKNKISAEKTEVSKNILNDYTSPKNNIHELSSDLDKESTVPCNGLEGLTNRCSERITPRTEDNKKIKSLEETFGNSNLDQEPNPKDKRNGAIDYTADDTFETCSNKSEELEELYIKSNPLLANLVDIESLNNNERDIKDKNTITIDKQLLDEKNTNEFKIESTIVDSINIDEKIAKNENEELEPKKTETMDNNKLLTEENKVSDTQLETRKINNVSKKKSEKKKKKSKEDKNQQPPANTNSIKNKTKEKSPEPQRTKEKCTEKKVNGFDVKIVEKSSQSKSKSSDAKKNEMNTDTKSQNLKIITERKSPSPDQSPKHKNVKKKNSPPPPEKSNNKETAIDTATSFIDEMISEAVNKVKKQIISGDNTIQADSKRETANAITPDIPLQDKFTPKIESEVKSKSESKIEIQNKKISRKDPSKSIKKQTKSKNKTPERKPSKPPTATTVLHITDVVNKWLEEKHGGKLPVDYLDEDDDEEIFVQPNLTGSKNLMSNPSPAAFRNEIMGDRVADRTSDISDRCNAKDCVSKYYNFGIRTSPENEVLCPAHNKSKDTQFTYPASPIPCGICCIIQ